MAMWFTDKYVLRMVHEEAVRFYQAKVAELQRQLQDKQAELDAHNLQALIDYGHRQVERRIQRVKGISFTEYGDNIVSFDAHRDPKALQGNQT